MIFSRYLTGIAVAVLLTSLGGNCFSESQRRSNTAVMETHTDDGSGFSVLPSFKGQDIYGVYESAARNGEPQWITTDVVFHTAWRLFSFALRSTENVHNRPRLMKLCTALAKAAFHLHASLPPGETRQAAVQVSAYFSVGARLLDPSFVLPDEVKEATLADIGLINRHEGFAMSKTLPGMEDFSQYAPRGHYTINTQFRQYFKTMMWFGRRLFRVEERSPEGIGKGDLWDEEVMLRETREMLLIAYLIESTEIDGRPAVSLWEKISNSLDVFTGPMEDLDIPTVLKLSKEVWGKVPLTVAKDKLLVFISLARKATNPRIDSSGAGRRGFSLFGQRFLPDSYILQSLVSSKGSLIYAGGKGGKPFSAGRAAGSGLVRTFPRGLDILAALGSNAALDILGRTGDSNYSTYPEILSRLRKELPEIIESGRGKSAWCAMLYSLPSLFRAPEGSFVPGFLKTRTWALKQSVTALGGWVEFRHDTVLYSKQSYTEVGQALVPSVPKGYIEPYPEFYRRISRMVQTITSDALSSSILTDFTRTLGKMADISEKEIRGEALSEQEQQEISQIPLLLKSIATFPEKTGSELGLSIDSTMALVTDVHTDNNSRMVLEEAIGPPFIIKAWIRRGEGTIVFKGAVFSYFEFKQPVSDRLTDQKWRQAVLPDKGLSLLPNWTSLRDILK